MTRTRVEMCSGHSEVHSTETVTWFTHFSPLSHESEPIPVITHVDIPNVLLVH